MNHSVVIISFLLAVIAQASSLMLTAPRSVVGVASSMGAHGAAVSDFAGHALHERDTTMDQSNLRMMRHRKGFKKLNLPADQRKALLRGLTTQLIRHGRIKTTMVRAKAMRKPVEHMITLSKQGSLHARRQALAYLYDKSLVAALFESGPDRYGERPGGYTRIIRVDQLRKGDSAKMAIIELV